MVKKTIIYLSSDDMILTQAIIITLVFFPCACRKTPYVFIENNCDGKIHIETAKTIKLSEDLFYPNGWRCQTTLQAPPGHVIWLNFQSFDVGRPSVIYCTDVLRLYDGGDTKSPELTQTKGLCGRLTPSPVVSSGNQIVVRFKSMVATSSTGFIMTATAQRVPETKLCHDKEYQCFDDVCIAKELKCNGEVNCRDSSDESRRYAGCDGILGTWIDMNGFTKIAIIIGSATVLFILMCCIIGCCCSTSRRYKRLKD